MKAHTGRKAEDLEHKIQITPETIRTWLKDRRGKA